MSNVPTPVPRPAPRPAPPPLKTDAMEPLQLWEAYAASPPLRRAPSSLSLPPPLPPAASALSAQTATVLMPQLSQLSTVVLPAVKLPPKPPLARRFATATRKAARRMASAAAGLELRRRADGAWAWSSARARTAGAALAPKVRAATAPRFSLVTLVLVLVAAWGGAFAAGLGARMQRVEIVHVPAAPSPAP
jgi:hypothetical protein